MLTQSSFSPGNSIVSALAGLLYKRAQLQATLSEASVESNQARARKLRTYREAAGMCQTELRSMFLQQSLPATGQWLVHTENNGRPHCFGMDCHDADIVFFIDKNSFTLTRQIANSVFLTCDDRKTVVLFEVNSTKPAAVMSEALLDLLSGSGEALDDAFGLDVTVPPLLDADEDDAVVCVEAKLSFAMQQEVAAEVKVVSRRR